MDGARNKLLACPGFARDQNGGVCGSNLRNKREYSLQGARTPDDLVAHRSLIDFFGQGDALVFESLFRLLWIRNEYCPASHELPPDLESLHLVRSLCSLRALWRQSLLRTSPDGVVVSTISGRLAPLLAHPGDPLGTPRPLLWTNESLEG